MNEKIKDLLRSLIYQLYKFQFYITSTAITTLVYLISSVALLTFVGQWPSIMIFGMTILMLICSLLLLIFWERSRKEEPIYTVDDLMVELAEIHERLDRMDGKL